MQLKSTSFSWLCCCLLSSVDASLNHHKHPTNQPTNHPPTTANCFVVINSQLSYSLSIPIKMHFFFFCKTAAIKQQAQKQSKNNGQTFSDRRRLLCARMKPKRLLTDETMKNTLIEGNIEENSPPPVAYTTIIPQHCCGLMPPRRRREWIRTVEPRGGWVGQDKIGNFTFLFLFTFIQSLLVIVAALLLTRLPRPKNGMTFSTSHLHCLSCKPLNNSSCLCMGASPLLVVFPLPQHDYKLTGYTVVVSEEDTGISDNDFCRHYCCGSFSSTMYIYSYLSVSHLLSLRYPQFTCCLSLCSIISMCHRKLLHKSSSHHHSHWLG